MSEPAGAYPPIDFNTFVLSLGTSVLINLGEIADPATGIKETSLPMAKQTIDLLALLEEKTRGNLSGEEERLLGQLQEELQAKFQATSGLEAATRSSILDR